MSIFSVFVHVLVGMTMSNGEKHAFPYPVNLVYAMRLGCLAIISVLSVGVYNLFFIAVDLTFLIVSCV